MPRIRGETGKEILGHSPSHKHTHVRLKIWGKYEEKIYTKHLECDENVIISFSRRFKTSTSDNCALTPLRRQDFLRIVFEKIICLLDRSWNHIHSFMETITFCVFIHANETYHHHHHLSGNCMFMGMTLNVPTWYLHVVLELTKRFVFC